jgi:predicted RNase H-like HicB family nuclease
MEEQLIRFTIEYEQEEDGRWLAEVLELPGVLAYGRTPEDAMAKAQALGLRVLADRIEHGEEAPALRIAHSTGTGSAALGRNTSSPRQ